MEWATWGVHLHYTTEHETKTARQSRRDQKWRSERHVGGNTYTPIHLYDSTRNRIPNTRGRMEEQMSCRVNTYMGYMHIPCVKVKRSEDRDQKRGRGGKGGGAIGL